MQVHENKKLHVLDKNIDDEPACVLRILITKDKILLFYNYNLRMYSSL
jgi:hypothetical protein